MSSGLFDEAHANGPPLSEDLYTAKALRAMDECVASRAGGVGAAWRILR